MTYVSRWRTLSEKPVGSVAVVPPPPSTTTWNSADKSGITLSGGDLIATYSSTTDAQVRSIASHSTGKYHCEFTVGAITDVGFPVVGIASASHAFSNYCGQDLNSIGWATSEFQYLNAVSTVVNSVNSTNWQIVTGDVIAIEVDLDGLTIQYQNFTKGSGWSSDVHDISTMTNAPFYICVNLKTAADSITLNAGGSAYSVTPTVGYGNW